MPDLDILIATPAAHGLVTTRYSESLFALRDALYARGIKHSYETMSMSDIEGSRNLLASSALARKCSHVLFIDSDMGFRPRAVERLIDLAKPVVGAICPKRQLNLFQALSDLKPQDMQQPGWQKRFLSRATGVAAGALIENSQTDNGFARFTGIGMAVALIASDALRRLIETASASEQIPIRTSVVVPSLWLL